MGRDLQHDAVDENGGLSAYTAIWVAAICFIAVAAALALCGSSVSRSTHNSSPSTGAVNQPQSDAPTPEEETVPERQWAGRQDISDSPEQVCICSANSWQSKHDPAESFALCRI